jgi:hypothetical protein
LSVLLSTDFRVKDEAAWKADLDFGKLVALAGDGDGFVKRDADGYWSFGWDGLYPRLIIAEVDDDTDQETETDLSHLVARHIVEEDVCIVRVSGSEKLIYCGGDVWFIAAGRPVWVGQLTGWHTRETRATVLEQHASDKAWIDYVTGGPKPIEPAEPGDD